ncbi:MAG: septum site-determining protein MinC [Aquificae bacterium]|nr:septum site-determining protein MinC [Aquificota bacterium]
MIKVKSKPLTVLVVEVEGSDPEEVKQKLEETFGRKFFSIGNGMPFLIQAKNGVPESTIAEIENYLRQKGLKPLLQTVGGDKTVKQVDLEKVKGSEVLIVNKNLRAGQSIEHAGDVLIIGDVNPGAQVKATGNIIVMGALKGVAWAGYLGNQDAVIVALRMEPQQLRIGNIIAVPDEGEPKPKAPEVARVKGDEIVIEPLV